MIGIAVAVCRGIQFAAVLSMFGTLVVAMFVAPAALRDASPEATRQLNRRLTTLLRGGALVALPVGVIWLLVQAAEMADADSILATIEAVPIALFDSRFGQALGIRFLLLLAAIGFAGSLTSRIRVGLALLTAAAAVVAQSWMGHPAAASDNLLLGASIAHVLAAGAWLGALVPLFLVVRATPGAGAARAAGRFSWIGGPAVLVLAITAWLQGVPLIGSEAGLLGTKYGQLASFKLVLFGVLFLIAVVNRFKLSPKLEGADAARANRHLTTSIAIETVLGLLVVLAASWLATGTPATHEEPDWPFALRPNWPLLDDPLVRNAFIEAAILLVLAVCLIGRAALFRRWRWPAVVLAIGLLWYGNKLIDDAPFLDPIFVEAFPTSYYFSQSGFTANAIAQGAQVFAQNCVACHGEDARGDGPAAKQLPVPPANLTQQHVWMHSDGELFWWLTNGIEAPNFGTVMPGWGTILSTDDRWALIDYIHAHLAGSQMAGKGLWTTPITAPGLAAVCSDGDEFDLTDAHGKFVRIVALGLGDYAAAGQWRPAGAADAAPCANSAGCIAEGDDAWTAYATMAHVSPDQLAGTQFLVDPNGMVRWTLAPQDAAQWATPATLAAVTKEIAAHPLSSVANSMAGMKM